MKIRIALAAAGAALLSLVSTAATAATADKPAPRECFWTREADGFAAPDNQTLYVRVGSRNRVFRFEMFGPCLDMDWNQRLALVSRGGSNICSGMDAEVVSHATGLGAQRCAVRNMHKLTPEEIAALPPKARP